MSSATQEEIDRIGYDLSKRVPDMRRGFRIETSYGGIEIAEEDAKLFADLAELQLTKRISALQRKGGLK